MDTVADTAPAGERGTLGERLDRAAAVVRALGADPDANVRALTAATGELLGGAGAWVRGQDADVELVAPPGFPWPAEAVTRSPLVAAARAADAAAPLVAPRPGEAARSLGDPTLAALGVGGFVGAPVALDGRPAGVLAVFYDAPSTPAADDLRLLGLLAASVGAQERRRRDEAALRASRDKYRELSELGGEAIFLIENETGRLLEANTAATTMYGYSRDELLARRNVDLSAEPSETRRITRGSSPGATTVPLRYHKRKDGAVFPVEIDGRFFRFEGRDVHVAAIRDISERLRLEEALERRIGARSGPSREGAPPGFEDLFDLDEMQRMQDAFAAATGVASIITRPDGTPLTRPSRFCRLCIEVIRGTEKGRANCYASDAELGRHEPGGPIVQRCLSGGLWDAGASITVDGRHVANWLIGQVKNEAVDEASLLAYADEIGADRDDFAAALAEVPVMSTQRFERVAEAVFLLANELSEKAWHNQQQARLIDELRRADEERERGAAERERLQAQLQQAMKMEAIGRLAGGVAHDFNNLLTTIQGNIELLLLDAGPDDSSVARLREVSAATANAAALTRQILAFSRKQVIEPQIVSLDGLVTDLSRLLRRLIGEDVTLVTRLAPDVGSVRVDPGQFEQVLVNLAVNARDAMPAGGTLTIATERATLDTAAAEELLLPPGEYVALLVSDTGHGMSPEVLARIFEPFFTTKPRGRGTGLGLATTYGAVQQAGGVIDVTSAPGRGTTFRILLPRADQPADSAPAAEAPAPETPGGTATVLLAEDDDQVRKYAVTALKRLGYEVLAAPDGRAALELVRERPAAIDLLLTDVVMPGMSGPDLADALRRLHPGLPVLFCSGYAEDLPLQRGEVDAAVRFLAKPYSFRQLAEAIRDALES